KRENCEVTTTRAPRRVVSCDFFFGQTLALAIRKSGGWSRDRRGDIATGRNSNRLFTHSITKLLLDFAQTGRDVCFDAFENFADTEGETVGLGQAADLRIAEARAKQAAELAIAIQAFVVHFDDADVVESG